MAGTYQTDVVIVGAGIAGLLAAHSLIQQGARVTLVEKGHAPGGRLATRTVGPGVADHGAQFFSARSAEFQGWVDGWLDRGLAYEWSRGWSSGSLGAAPPDGNQRYAVQGGMIALATHLARGLDVRLDTRLVSVTPEARGWRALDEKGRTYTAPALLLTPPVPQSLALIEAGQVTLAPADRAALDLIDYMPCLAGIFWLDRPPHLPEPGAVHRIHAPITWIADNRRKGISPDATLVTVHAGPDYSHTLWPLPDWEVLVALESGLRLFKDEHTNVIEAHLERWRYAMPTARHTDTCLMADGLPPLVFAGDAFGGARVEGAALSGLAAGAVLGAKVS